MVMFIMKDCAIIIFKLIIIHNKLRNLNQLKFFYMKKEKKRGVPPHKIQ